MSFFRNSVSLLVPFILILVLVVSCKNDDAEISLDVGYLVPNLQVITITESEGGRTENVNTDDFVVSVYEEGGTLHDVIDPFSSISPSYSLPVGNYYIEAHSNNNTIASFSGDAYYTGTSAIFSIDKEEVQTVDVDMAVSNAQLTVVWADTTLNTFNTLSLTAENVTTNDVLVYTPATSGSGYFATGYELSLTVDATYDKVDGGQITESFSASIPNLEAKHYTVTVTLALEDGQVSFNFNVDDTIEEENVDINNIPDNTNWFRLGGDINGEAEDDWFGTALALSGNGLVVAAGTYQNDGNGNRAGHVRIFENVAGSWVQIGSDIDGDDAEDFAGYSVSTSYDGQIVAVGIPQGSLAGTVRVYENQSGTWVQVGADIIGEAQADYSGTTVSLSDDGQTLAIGATGNDNVNGNASGHVRVYENQSGSWVQVGADIDGEAFGDSSGWSLALSGDASTVIIGSRQNSDAATDAGHARVYENQAGSWVQVGADLDGEAAGDYFGATVSISSDGQVIAIGSANNDNAGNVAGHVKIYENQSGNWVQIGADIEGQAVGDRLGSSVSLSADGTIVAIGAATSNSTGKVRVYENQGGSWIQLGSDMDGEAAGDWFGEAVSISADGLIVAAGARLNDGTDTDAGHVRVHEYK